MGPKEGLTIFKGVRTWVPAREAEKRGEKRK